MLDDFLGIQRARGRDEFFAADDFGHRLLRQRCSDVLGVPPPWAHVEFVASVFAVPLPLLATPVGADACE